MNVERRTSKIHGSGVFARQAIEYGDWQYLYGEVLPLQPHRMEHYCFDHPNGLWLPYAPWCWLNHADRPNLAVEWTNTLDTYTIYATQDIKRGTELTINYGFDPASV